MSSRLRIASLAAFLLTGAACKGSSSAAPDSVPGATAAASATTSAVSPAAAASTRARQLYYCPSAVMGASTVIRDGKGSYDVVVTAAAPADVTEIRDRSKHLAEMANKDPANHAGIGMGVPSLEACPALVRDSTVTETDIEGGAAITVVPTHPEALIAIRRHSFFLAKKLSPP